MDRVLDFRAEGLEFEPWLCDGMETVPFSQGTLHIRVPLHAGLQICTNNSCGGKLVTRELEMSSGNTGH